MCLKVVENGKHKDVHIKEGQVSGCVICGWMQACVVGCVHVRSGVCVACVFGWVGACVVGWVQVWLRECDVWLGVCDHVWFWGSIYNFKIKYSIIPFSTLVLASNRLLGCSHAHI